MLLALVWQLYAQRLNNPLLIPTFLDTVQAFRDAIATGGLLGKAWYSIQILLMGYAAGLALAALLTMLAITSRIGTDLLETLTAMFNPLPAIALLPLALIWFGLGHRQPGVRADPFGAVGRGAQHALRLPVGVEHVAHGRAATMACAACRTSPRS